MSKMDSYSLEKLVEMVSDCEDSATLDQVFEEVLDNQSFRPGLADINYLWDVLDSKTQEDFSADLQDDLSVSDLVCQLAKEIERSPFDRDRVLSEMEGYGIFKAYMKEKILKK